MTDELAQGRLTARIIIGLVAGLAVGLLINGAGPVGLHQDLLVDGLFNVVGSIFIASLKLLVVPLVFVSLVCGTAALDDVSKLGRVGGRTLALYLLTTAAAISLALLLAVLVSPGEGFDLPTELSFDPREPPSITGTLISLFPTNPVKAMAEGNMLQIIVFSILFGLAVTLAGEPGTRLLAGFRDANAVVLRLVLMLVHLAPYGVFCLIAKVFATQGFGAILHLAQYFVVVLVTLVLHALVVYPLLVRGLAGLSPVQFFRKMRDPMVLAFSTASSNATLPVTLENVERRLGVSNGIASFTVPLGATINMDGTAIMQGVATVFIAQVYGVDLSMGDLAAVVLTATMASIGAAGVPGVGLITLALVLEQVGLPVEGIAMIIGVDRLLDMVRTAVNVTGDATVSLIVAELEGQVDKTVFGDWNADVMTAQNYSTDGDPERPTFLDQIEEAEADEEPLRPPRRAAGDG